MNFLLLGVIVGIFIVSFWLPYRRSGKLQGFFSFLSALLGFIAGIFLIYRLIEEEVIMVRIGFGSAPSEGLGFIPLILLLSPVAGFLLLPPILNWLIKVLPNVKKMSNRKKVTLLIPVILIVIIGFDFYQYQTVHDGLWDSGFKNYIFTRFGVPHAL